jgi:hypothetical protein
MSRFRTFPHRRIFARLLLVGGGALLLVGATFSSADTDGRHRKAMCAYRLMQLGRAIRLFAEDHDGYICKLSGRVDQQGIEGADNAQRVKDAYAPYVLDPEIWYCPADPYAKTHTLLAPGFKPPQDQPDMRYDRYYMSYRHYAYITQEEPPARLDALRLVQDERTAALPGGVWIATPDMIMLMMDDGRYHGPSWSGVYGKVYGQNVLFRDGHVKFETEETMRRPKR